MKPTNSRILFMSLVLWGCGASQTSQLHDEDIYTGSTFGEVWGQVASDPYSELPQYEVSIGSFGRFFSNKLRRSAKRTLSDRSDLLPRFDKLVHPNGICLAGKWTIDQETPYTGYFRQNREALIIARASVALTDTTRGSYRAFGLAGKLFPTSQPDHQDALKTANFFTVDDLGGTMAESFLETPLLNKPKLTTEGRSAYVKAIGAVVGLVFSAQDSNPNERQLYEISELGESDPSQAVTPRYMRIQGESNNQQIEASQDFRDELRLSNFESDLSFGIEVSEDQQTWQQIGQIRFTEDAVSDSCDHRLHFHHPKFRNDLQYGDR